MIHEATISFTVASKNGDGKTVKESYIIDNRNLFAEVEDVMYVNFDGYKDLDVISVKRSKIKEVANSRESEEDRIFIATLVDVFYEPDGGEKEVKYQVAFYSQKMNTAWAFIREYISQGYNMKIACIKETKFIDVVK